MIGRRIGFFAVIVAAIAINAGAWIGGCGSSDSAAVTSTSGTSGSSSSSSGDPFGGDGGDCGKLGSACATGTDCCSGTCVGGVCNLGACVADGQACSASADCCGGSCVGGACAALSGDCKSLNNPCNSASDCCSGLCTNGQCGASSFCAQNGDVCGQGTDCCSGVCLKPDGGGLYGACAPAPTGSANCTLTDGMLCAGQAISDGGGVPPCGGSCCSRLCAPYGPTGVMVCQPASGCHVVGDLCTTDGDCCGSVGLPGGSGKPVTCDIQAPFAVGVCRNPMGCKPDGDICKLATRSCNASCNCCSGNCETQDTCKVDSVGVPRCAPEKCAMKGEACASSASCCDGLPCIPNPDPSGKPPFICGNPCSKACGTCTIDADCCPGTTCHHELGSTQGTCGPCGDAGVDGGDDAGSDAGMDAGMPDACASYLGQGCTTSADCCNALFCVNSSMAECTAADAKCTCQQLIPK